MSDSATVPSRFLYVLCQTAATPATRQEVASLGGLKLAYSQPGFVTFKVEEGATWPERLTLPSTLARCYGWTVGRHAGSQAGELLDQVLTTPELDGCQHLHVYQRDLSIPGDRGFEPGVSELAAAVAEVIRQRCAESGRNIRINQVARPDEKIFDIVIVQPHEWTTGIRYALTRSQRWIGGAPQLSLEHDAISRAYFKLEEALLWSGFRWKPGELIAEIGSAPGGAVQFLLERGHPVIAVDPAELDESIRDHEQLVHFRKRGKEMKKRDFRDARWLLADLNQAPQFTLDTAAEIVGHSENNIRGMLLTLKLPEWGLVNAIPEMRKQVQAMGFQRVQTRQLAFNRQEFCLAAVRDRFEIRQRNRR